MQRGAIAVNVQRYVQFVVHLVDESLGEAMNICAIDVPPGVSETEQAGLTLVPSAIVKPKRIAQARDDPDAVFMIV